VNNKIKARTRQAYGYRDEAFFILKLLSLHHAKIKLVGVTRIPKRPGTWERCSRGRSMETFPVLNRSIPAHDPTIAKDRVAVNGAAEERVRDGIGGLQPCREVHVADIG